MTRDDVIRAAGEAGFHFYDAGFAPTLHTVPLEHSEKCFERFAAIIEAAATKKASELADQRVVAEREACAKVCEMQFEHYDGTKENCFDSPFDCAVAIRARGDEK